MEDNSLCGGAGSCGNCRVRRVDGELNPATQIEGETLTAEDLAAGWRLACQAVPLSDVRLAIPPESLTTPQRLQVEGQESEVELDPVVTPIDVQLHAPNLDDLRADTTRLQEALKGRRFALLSISIATKRFVVHPQAPARLEYAVDLNEHRRRIRRLLY